MKQLKLILATIVIALATVCSNAYAGQSLDKVVAIVNDGVITQSQLDSAINMAKKRIAQTKYQMPSNDVLKQQVLQQLILQKLQLQIAKRAKITISKKQVDAAIARIAENNKLTLAQLKQKALTHGMDWKKFRASIKNQLLLTTVQQQAAMQNMKITQRDMNAMKAKVRNQLQSMQKYQVVDILISNNDKALANKVRNALVKGETTQTVSSQYPSISVNDLGMQSAAQLPDLFVKAVSNMKVGAVSQPIAAGNGIHLLKLVDKKTAQAQMPNDNQIKMLVAQQKFNAALMKWLKQLRKTAYIKIMTN